MDKTLGLQFLQGDFFIIEKITRYILVPVHNTLFEGLYSGTKHVIG